MQKQKEATSIFNIPQIQKELNFRQLYDKQKKMRIFYENKAQQLQAKLSFYMKENRHPFRQQKKQRACDIIQEIKSFKSILPNSVRQINLSSSNLSIDNSQLYFLIKEFSIYGIHENDLKTMKLNIEGTTIVSSQNKSQILEHTSRLIFPSGIHVSYYSGKKAYEKSLEIISISKQKLNSFILSFEPTNNIHGRDVENDEQLAVLNLLNPQRRVYAICIALEDFTVVAEQFSPLQTHEQVKKKSEKTVRFKQIDNKQSQEIKIAVSMRVYCIFSYYPFFSFFQEIIQNILFSAKLERFSQFKENGQNLELIDSRRHSEIIKYAFQSLKNEGDEEVIILNKLIGLSVGQSNKVYLKLTNQMCTSYLSQYWAFPILSLFTLDVFLNVFTLMILEEKMIFVCSNSSILTYAIFLFTCVLIHPFQYPYPVVNLIPDQEDYLQAPFPIVYGYNKTKEQITAKKLQKKYDNIFVFFEPSGVEVMGHQNMNKIIAKKSPQLRDRLISKFKKMKKNYPQSTLFNFMRKKNVMDFQFTTNHQLSKQIIHEVQDYLSTNVFNLLPAEEEIKAIRSILQKQQIEQDDINLHILKKIKQTCALKSKDPFFAAFLETQILNVYLFKN